MSAISIRTTIPGPASRALMRRREAAVPRGIAHSLPIFAASASGATVTDVDGKLEEGLEVLSDCFVAAAAQAAMR